MKWWICGILHHVKMQIPEKGLGAICKILTPFVCPEFHAVNARLRKLIRYLLHVNQVVQCWEICTYSSTEAEGYSELLWSNICRAVRPSFINFHNMNWFHKLLKGISGGVVACGARGLWVESWSRRYNFRDWLSPASKSWYGSKIAKATQKIKTTNQPTETAQPILT